MLKFLCSMLIPLYVLIYTIQFGRWMQKKRQTQSAVSAYAVGTVAFLVSGCVLWRILK
jgi:uncharacterized membrane protein YhfC